MKNTTWIAVLVLIVLAVGGYVYRSQIQSLLTGSGYSTTTNQTVPPAPVVTTTGDIVMTKTDPAKGNYLAGPNGMTLYIFDKDTPGVSNCSGNCAQLWPPYTTATTPAILPANVTTLTRADGSIQYAYNGQPLYYYTPDKAQGDITGDGVGGVWHLVKP